MNGRTQVVGLSKPFVAQKIMNESQMLRHWGFLEFGFAFLCDYNCAQVLSSLNKKLYRLFWILEEPTDKRLWIFKEDLDLQVLKFF